MPASALTDLIESLKNKAKLGPEDALAARRVVFASVEVTQDEAEALIALNQAAQYCSPEWSDAFVEALTDYVVRQRQPSGYVDQACADWLTFQLLKDGRIASDTELELLVRVLERATTAPSSLVMLALQQVKAAVVEGQGPLRQGMLDPGRISRGEVQILSRILYAAGGDDDLAITRAEAELLFDINDACRLQPNDSGWADLFSKAIIASVMTVSGYEPTPRADRLRQEAWLASPDLGLGGFLVQMFKTADVKASLSSILHPDAELDAEFEAVALREANSRAAELINDSEAEWLVSRIGKDGVFDPAERAVIEFIRRESPSISPQLQDLVDAVGESAKASAPAKAVFGRRASA